MSARSRVIVLVALAAVAAAAAAVGIALVQANGATGEGSEGRRPSGAPPLFLDLGVRGDAEARALRRAEMLYRRGRRAAAARIFARYESIDAKVGAAVAAWPDGTVPRLQRLSGTWPRNAVVRLNLGFALFWAGRGDEGVAALRLARRIDPDSSAAVRADDLLHRRDFAPGLPIFVPSFAAPTRVAPLTPRRLAVLARAARHGGPRQRILYGVALQRLGRPVSARRQFDAAAALAPRDVEMQVAAAVGRFDKSDPARAFARLGPLARRFPRSQSVRFHLGLLLLWMRDVEAAKRQLRIARGVSGSTLLGREATRYLAVIQDAQR